MNEIKTWRQRTLWRQRKSNQIHNLYPELSFALYDTVLYRYELNILLFKELKLLFKRKQNCERFSLEVSRIFGVSCKFHIKLMYFYTVLFLKSLLFPNCKRLINTSLFKIFINTMCLFVSVVFNDALSLETILKHLHVTVEIELFKTLINFRRLNHFYLLIFCI